MEIVESKEDQDEPVDSSLSPVAPVSNSVVDVEEGMRMLSVTMDAKLLSWVNIALCDRCKKGFNLAKELHNDNVVIASSMKFNKPYTYKNGVRVFPREFVAFRQILIDSGTSRHLIPWIDAFMSGFNDKVGGEVTMGSEDHKIDIEGEGQLRLRCLRDVLYVPELSRGLISVGQLDEEGYSTIFEDSQCFVRRKSDNKIALVGVKDNNVYFLAHQYEHYFLPMDEQEDNASLTEGDSDDDSLGEKKGGPYTKYHQYENYEAYEALAELGADVEVTAYNLIAEEHKKKEEEKEKLQEHLKEIRGSYNRRSVAKTTEGVAPMNLLHQRTGHLADNKIKKVAKHKIASGLQYSYEEIKDQSSGMCPACEEGGMKASAREDRSQSSSEIPFQKFAIDYKGKFQVVSIDGYNGFYLICDYLSNYLMVFMVKSKGQKVVTEILKEFYEEVYKLTKNNPIAIMQCDYDTVLQSKEIVSWLRRKGIKLQMSAPYTHWQNGGIEANMGKVMDFARTLMAAGRVPTRFWSYAIRHAVYLSNREPVNRVETTPLTVVTGIRPDWSNFVPFWTPGVALKSAEERKGPWDFKVRVRFLGFDESTKNGFLVYDIEKKKVYTRHDCIWDEKEFIESMNDDLLRGEIQDDDLPGIITELRDAGEMIGDEESDEDEEYYHSLLMIIPIGKKKNLKQLPGLKMYL